MQQTSLHRTALELVASRVLVDIAEGGFEIEYILLMLSPAPLWSMACHTDDGGGLPRMSCRIAVTQHGLDCGDIRMWSTLRQLVQINKD